MEPVQVLPMQCFVSGERDESKLAERAVLERMVFEG